MLTREVSIYLLSGRRGLLGSAWDLSARSVSMGLPWYIRSTYSIPSRENVSNNPDRLSGILCGLKLLDHPGELARYIWIGRVDEVQVIRVVPKISVESDNAKAGISLDGITAVMSASVRSPRCVEPSFTLPKTSNMVLGESFSRCTIRLTRSGLTKFQDI